MTPKYSENETDHNNNPTESPQGETSVEPNKNPIEETQHNPLQIIEPSYFEILTGQIQNPPEILQQQFSAVFSSE